jgi:allantoate deiminase
MSGTSEPAIDGALVERYVLELARHGAVGETGVSRPAYGPAWVAAQGQVAEWCQEAGLEVRTDAAGNLWGRLEGSEPEKGSIVSGSHIDSQVPGGRYDGALGVLAALVAVRTLHRSRGRPRRTLEVLSLCDEEASRFTSDFWGSRTITGRIRPEELRSLRDRSGVTVEDAMKAAGLAPDRIAECARRDIDTFLELHIEQGPVLEDADLPVGIVYAITGLRHCLVDLVGRTDHAGARPMASRRDAMAGAAEIATRVIEYARAAGAPAVTTVGRMEVEPNIIAAVPGRVALSIDGRHPDPDALRRMWEHHLGVVEEVARARDLEASWEMTLDAAPTACDEGVVRLLRDTASELGIPFRDMHSGAGHDTQHLASIARAAMIFVRSVGGVSHTPNELTRVDDAVQGIRLLTAALGRLAYGPG